MQKNAKSINYGNSSYGNLITENNSRLPVPPLATSLPLPAKTDDFFSVAVDGDKQILISRSGYLKLTLKSTISVGSLGSYLDVQLIKNTSIVLNSRKRFGSSTYIEANFALEVLAGDILEISVESVGGDVAFEYVAASGSMEEQATYQIELELLEHLTVVEDFSDIGQVIEHTNRDLNLTNARYVPLDTVDGWILPDALYPRLKAILAGTAYLDPNHAVTGEFKVVSCLAYPYTRGGNIVFQNEELPSLGLNVTIGQTSINHNHSLDESGYTVDQGELGRVDLGIYGNNPNPVGEISVQNQGKNCFRETNFRTLDDPNIHDSVGSQCAGFILDDLSRPLDGTTMNKDVQHTHSPSVTHNPLYSGGTNIKPKAIGVYRYIIGDKQL